MSDPLAQESVFFEDFVQGIHEQRLAEVTFLGIVDGLVRSRTCAPMDVGVSRRKGEQRERFHLWDFDSPDGSHTLSLLPEQVLSFKLLEQNFLPGQFVTWSPNWWLARDWGSFS